GPGSEGAPAEVRGDPEDSLGGRAGDLAVLQRRDLRDQRPAAQLRGATRLLRAAARGWYRVAAMHTYVLRRVWQSAVTLVGVSILVFVILRVIPGDPAKMLLPEGAPESAVEALNRHLGLREPLWVQYGIFLRSVVRGDFGQSFQYRSPALRVVVERVPATIQLALCAMALTVLVGVSLGIVAAVRQGTAYDYAGTVLAVLGQSLPNFWLGIMLMLLFGVTLRW